MQAQLTRQTRQVLSTRFWALLSFCALAFSFGSYAQTFDLTVAKDGTGNYTTVQAAINAAPTGRTTAYRILIKNGTYTEKVSIPSNRPFLQLIGESVANTIITWNDGASTVVNGATLGTSNSYTFQSNANDFLAMNITFVNSFGDGSQAVAVSAGGDRVVFKNCRMLGNQDTLLTNSNGLQYYKNCYIDGNVDFIFGPNRAVFDNCVVYAKSRTSAGSSYITAANTPAGQAFGYVFRNTILPANTGATQYSLGRPWQNSGTPNTNPANNKVVFLKSRVGFGLLQPTGWSVWDTGTNTSVITYAEFQPKYFNGNNLNTSQRVPWSQQLAPADTAQYTVANLFGTWNPCAVAANICTSFTPDIAVSNFRAVKSGTQVSLDWNISWAMTGIRYEVFRSTDNVNFTSFYNTTATNDSTYNFRTTDAVPAPGTAYYYYLRASKTGLATHQTATQVISSVPTITVSGNLGPFAQYLTGTSAVQTYSVSGVNLTGDLTITAPANYEISPNGGTQWYSSATPVVLPQTNNAVAATTISVRLNATAAGTYAGNIVHTSAGAAATNVAVTGTKVNVTADPTLVLEQWALSANAQPNITAAGVTPTSPTFNGLNLSDGSTAAGSIPGYSTLRGQAFAPLATGGGWTSGTLSRNIYQEFTVTAASTHTLRVDSLIFSSSFYNSANGVVGVSYSTTSPFPATPSEVTGGVLPMGGDYDNNVLVAQPAGATGAFATTATTMTKVVRRNSGPLVNINTYRLALNNTTGVPVAAGQTLTIRLYYALGSSSTPRQAFLRDVSAKGTSTSNAPCDAAFTYPAAAYCVNGTTNPQPTITGTVGGTFSAGAGLSINATTGVVNLGLSTPGTYTVTYNVSSACSSTVTVTITAPQTANIGYGASSYCTSTTGTVAVGIGTGSTAGTFTSSATGLTLNATTGAITPSTSTPGTYFVTNTVAASGGCTAATGSTTVTITAPATAGFSYGSATYCASQSTAVTPAMTTGASTGTFSSTTGLTINAATGTITPSTSTPGTYTVTNTVAAAGGCAAVTSTFSVTITAPATAGFSYGAAAYCASQSTAVTPTLSAGASTGTFSSTTGLTINASTGAITPATSTAGTYTVTNTVAAAGGCAAATATFSVTVTAAPTAGFTYPSAAYCRTATGAVAATPGTGSTAGTFSSTAGLTINATTGAITPGTSTAGTYLVTNTVAASGGCAAVTSTFTVTINATPATPTVTPAYNGTVTTLTSSAPTGNQWYYNNGIIPGATGQTYVVNGTGAGQLGSYTVVTTSAQGCASAASNPLVVTASRTALAGTSLNVYPNPATTGTLTVELVGYSQPVTLTLLNALGQQVLTRVVAGNAKPTLPLNGLTAGVYVLRATTAGGTDTRRIVVSR